MPKDKKLLTLLYKSIYNKGLTIAKSSAFAQKICAPIRAVGTLSEEIPRFLQFPQRHTSRRNTHKGQGEKEKKMSMRNLPRNA